MKITNITHDLMIGAVRWDILEKHGSRLIVIKVNVGAEQL
jgi:hypothetical protein